MKKEVSEKLLHDYLEYGRTKDEIYQWAYEEVEKNLHIQLVIALVEKCETERDIAYVAAGPLEDIMKQEPESVKEILDKAANSSAKMRKALEGVWIFEPSKGRDLLIYLLKKHKLTEGAL